MPSKYFSVLTEIFLIVFKPIINHVKVLYGQFDPVLNVPKDVQNLDQLPEFRKQRVEADKSKHSFFLFSFGIFVFNIVDSIYIMAIDDFDYNNYRMQELFYHKMYPENFWSQSDLIVFSIILCSLVVYYNLWRGDWLNDRFNMYLFDSKSKENKLNRMLIVNNKGSFYSFTILSSCFLILGWNKENTFKIIRFRETNSQMRRICMGISYFFFQPYFQYHLWSKYERGVRHAFLSGYLSVLLCYTVFC